MCHEREGVLEVDLIEVRHMSRGHDGEGSGFNGRASVSSFFASASLAMRGVYQILHDMYCVDGHR